ncbi:SDR family oxidoreductase [Actinomadura livida]|uniref:NAD(P)-dependent dehydrogenase (Short-subunit alcohol dehydrogenase family) n=1 Tax=Actinomadura livida TaxID=79909 RepID=A0A7W7N0Z6_9ACTN|nr:MULTISPECIES: SDR family oxidoreductase [Actinomadura]MBB4777410.1 NAD(P)-dependent dehydrogenase (short-subunit alcohol dehydrogenase family) [Actinomadura catellatispora]GGU31759.1 short-chain dehydrogenase [Actinomadura livida]
MARTIAVSGSASGIGQALASMLRDAGDTVIGIDLRDADVRADLGGPEGRSRAVAEVLDLSGGTLDAVVACAGVSDFTVLPVKVNYFGAVALLDGLRPALARAAAPRAAVVGSIAGTHPVDEAVVRACLDGDEAAALRAAAKVVEAGAGSQTYSSSKSALAQWLRRACVTPEWAGAGIPLNAIAPGVVRTPMTEPLFADEAMFQIMNEAVPMPLNGYADAEVIAEALRWLISPVNTHMTGQVIYVDGGAEPALRDPGVF